MLIKNDIKEKTRLIGKVGGYWITLEKYTKGDLPEVVKDGLAAVGIFLGLVAIFIGIGMFYCFFP